MYMYIKSTMTAESASTDLNLHIDYDWLLHFMMLWHCPVLCHFLKKIFSSVTNWSPTKHITSQEQKPLGIYAHTRQNFPKQPEDATLLMSSCHLWKRCSCLTAVVSEKPGSLRYCESRLNVWNDGDRDSLCGASYHAVDCFAIEVAVITTGRECFIYTSMSVCITES